MREIQTYVSLPLPAVSAQAFTCSLRPNGGEFYGLKSTPFHYHSTTMAAWPHSWVSIAPVLLRHPHYPSILVELALQADFKWLWNKRFSNQGFCWKESTAAQENVNTIHFNSPCHWPWRENEEAGDSPAGEDIQYPYSAICDEKEICYNMPGSRGRKACQANKAMSSLHFHEKMIYRSGIGRLYSLGSLAWQLPFFFREAWLDISQTPVEG